MSSVTHRDRTKPTTTVTNIAYMLVGATQRSNAEGVKFKEAS